MSNEEMNKRDKSTKEFEILQKYYYFSMITRKLLIPATWKHHKYYKTLEGAKDAIKDFRKYGKQNFRNENNEFPGLIPTVYIYRYKIIRRFI